MATDAGELVVRLTADVTDIKAKLIEMTNQTEKFSSTTVASGVAIGITFSQILNKVVEFGISSVKSFMEQDVAIARLTSLVGVDAANAFKNYAEKVQETTIFSNTSVIALEAQLSSFGVLPGSIGPAVDALTKFASATGKTLPEAGQALAQALSGQSRELNHYGLQISASDDKSTKLDKTVAFLADRFKDSAATIKGTVSGQLDTLMNQLDDLKQKIGGDVVKAIGWWETAMKTTAQMLGINIAAIKSHMDANNADLSVRQIAIAQLKNEQQEMMTTATNLGQMKNGVVVLTAAEQARYMMIGRQIAVLKQQEAQEKKTADAGKKGVQQVMTDAQKAVADRLAGYNKERDVYLETQNQIVAISAAATQSKIDKANEELALLIANEKGLTDEINTETKLRLEQSKQAWETNASYSDQLKVKMVEDINNEKKFWVDLTSQMVKSFASSTATMIVDGGRFSDVIKDLWKNLAKQVIAHIIEMIVEWLILEALTEGNAGTFAKVTHFGGAWAEGGMINEPSLVMGMRSGSVHLAGEAGPEAVVPTSGGGNESGLPDGVGGGGDHYLNINITGQFLEANPSKWQKIVRQTIVPEIRRWTMSSPTGPFTRKRGMA